MPAPLNYRPLYSGFIASLFGEPWPDWVKALRKKSGVYIIREPGGPVLYVGESHTGRLYDTFTRHFQSWSGRTAGPTYGRGSVECAVRLTLPGRAVAVQNKLICRLQPRDNTTSPVCPLKEPDPF
jgi:excinuclease UvrABC nuclease subunit